MDRPLGRGSGDGGLPGALATVPIFNSEHSVQAWYLGNDCSRDPMNNIPPVVKKERPDFLSEGAGFCAKRVRVETLVKNTTSSKVLRSPKLLTQNHYGAATEYVTARGTLEDNIAYLLAQMDGAHLGINSQHCHRNIPLPARPAHTLPCQMNNTLHVLNESPFIMFVPPSFKLSDTGYGINFIHKITLKSNLRRANLCSPEHRSFDERSAKHISSLLPESKVCQQIVRRSLEIEGKVTSSPLGSTIKSEKFSLSPSPDPIMSHKEYVHVLPFPKDHIPPSTNAAWLQSLHKQDITETESTKKIAVYKASVPSPQKKIDYPSGVTVSGEVVIVLDSSSKRNESLKKRVRFTRCSKDMKYLCAVCSKADCMKCSNCLNRSTGHQACKNKPKSMCLTYQKKELLFRHSPESVKE